MCLQNSGHNGVGPEALGWTVLGLHLLCFRSWVWVAGIQHRLEDTSASVDEPARRTKEYGLRRGVIVHGDTLKIQITLR